MGGSREHESRRSSPVPRTRGERVGRLGSMLAGIAGDVATGVLRRAVGRAEGAGSLIFTKANAQRLTQTLADLRGAAMKLGQMLSLEGEDLLPRELVDVLGALRDQADAMPEAQLRSVLEEELGRDWEDSFAEFDLEPIAAASIGQVHAARTRDGRDLALKIQYPGVAGSIDGDVDNLAILLRVLRLLPAGLDLGELVPELKSELRREADYGLEAANTERYRELVKDDPSVFVPRVHRDLSTRRVLATDRVHALPIDDLRSKEHPQALRDRLGGQLLRLVLEELFVFRFMQTDPNFANYLYEPESSRVALLDFGAARSFEACFTDRYRDLIIASVEGDTPRLLASAQALGFLRGDEGETEREALAILCELFSEPLRTRGPYDFARSDLSRRLHEYGLDLLRHHRLPRPPTDTLFLHRKLAGSFMLCARIRATVDCHALYRQILRPGSEHAEAPRSGDGPADGGHGK